MPKPLSPRLKRREMFLPWRGNRRDKDWTFSRPVVPEQPHIDEQLLDASSVSDAEEWELERLLEEELDAPEWGHIPVHRAA